MRRLLVIAAALGLMWALDAAQGGAQGTPGMALAAIGFVVLAAFTVGDLLKGLGLPRITGYIVSGLVLGPEVGGVLSRPVVADMTVFNTLALGLIALSAGLEIELGAMRRLMRTMAATVALKVPMLLGVVGGGLYLTHLYLLPLPVPDDAHAFVLAALIAVLGTGTSPSITLAIVNETKARGRLTDLTLGMAVLKDVVVIIALAVTIAVGRNSLSPEASEEIAAVVVKAIEHLGLSIAVGSAIGVMLILFVKYVHRELLLGAVCAVLLTAELSAYLDLELLLVLIAAGFVVRNASEQEHHLMPALLRISLPVFVVFFTTAGAKVDLAATLSVLPFAGGAALARAAVYYVSTRFGVWVGREGPAVRQNAWLAYIPQAGVTLGLVLLTAHETPELREQILRIGVAIVAINLLVGPVLLTFALGRAGEIPGRAGTAAGAGAGAGALPEATQLTANAAARLEAATAMSTMSAASTATPTMSTPRELPALTDERLEGARARLAADLEAWAARLIEQVIAPLAERGKLAIAHLAMEHKQREDAAAAVRGMIERASADPSEGLEARLRAAHLESRALAEGLPERLKVVTEPRLLRLSMRDGIFTALSKVLQRLARLIGLAPRRAVPVRLAARAASEERLAEALARVVPAWFDARGEMMRELARLVDVERGAEGDDVESVKQAVVRRAAAFTERAAGDLRAAVAAVVEDFHALLATLGGPGAPPSALGLFDMDERVRRVLGGLDAAAERERRVLRARMATLHADALHASITALLDVELEGMVRRPQAMVAEEMVPMIRELVERLPAAEEGWSDGRAPQGPDAADDPEAPLAALAAAVEQAQSERAAARLRGLQMKYYHATQEARLLARLAAHLEALPLKLVVVDRRAGAHLGRDLPLVTLEPARRLEEELIEGFSPDLVTAMRPLGDLVSALDTRVHQALVVASRGIAAARATEGTAEARLVAAREPVARARKLLQGLLDELAVAGEAATPAAAAVAAQTRERVAVVLGRASPEVAKALGRRRRRWWSALAEQIAGRAARLRGRIRTWSEAVVRALLRSPEVRDWIIRTGPARLDAVAMRELVIRDHAPPAVLGLPEVYAELLSPAPIDDDRLATARRGQLEALVAVLQPGKAEDFTAVLVVGERGSGRTSLVNVLGHRLARRRVIRLDARYHVRRGGPLAAVAAELGAPAEPGAVAAALRRAPSIVLLDDLERFLRASAASVEDLDRFLRLVRATAPHTHWVVTAQAATAELLEPFVHLSETFGRRVELAPLDADELDRVIQTRIQLSGLDVRCVDGARRARLRPREAHRRYLRTLVRLTGGNLRRALLLHARSITASPGGALVARDPRAPGLPFLRHLGAGPLAALSLVARYVELGPEDLAEGLGVAAADVDRVVMPLRRAGLVEAAAGRSTLAIPPHLVDTVCAALVELGVRAGGAP